MAQDFSITIWKEGEQFVAQCLNIDVSSFGKTYNEAMSNIREAIELYMEDADPSDIQKIEMPVVTTTSIITG